MKEKELYLSPQCEEITLRMEGVIAVSKVPDVAPGEWL